MNFAFRTYHSLSRYRALLIVFVAAVLLLGGTLLFSDVANANPISSIADNAISGFVGFILRIFIYVVGTLFSLAVGLFLLVAQHNTFIDHQAVQLGWAAVRDLANMFFVIVLIVIAFGTILRSQTYGYKNLLFKFIIMALLINFSDTIAGFFIDISQVVFLTFVDAFIRNAAELLTFDNALGLGSILQLNVAQSALTNASVAQDIDVLDVIAVAILGILFLVIATGVMLGLGFMLFYRIIALWILIILSPVSYLASILPATAKYSTMWWQSFTKYLFNAPVLGFFLWLTFGIIARSAAQIDATTEAYNTVQDSFGSGSVVVFPSEFGTVNQVTNYLVVIALLIGGAKVAQSVGGRGSEMGAKFASAAPKVFASGVKGVGNFIDRTNKRLGGGGTALLSEEGRANMAKGLKEGWKQRGARLDATGQEKREARLQQSYTDGKMLAGTRMAMSGLSSGDPAFWNAYLFNPLTPGKAKGMKAPNAAKVRDANARAAAADKDAEDAEKALHNNTQAITDATTQHASASNLSTALGASMPAAGGVSYGIDTFDKAQLMRNMIKDRMSGNESQIDKWKGELAKKTDPLDRQAIQDKIDARAAENADYNTNHSDLLAMQNEDSYNDNKAAIDGTFNVAAGAGHHDDWRKALEAEKDAQDKIVADNAALAGGSTWDAGQVAAQKTVIDGHRQAAAAARAEVAQYSPLPAAANEDYAKAEKAAMSAYEGSMDADGFATAISRAMQQRDAILLSGLVKKSATDGELPDTLKKMGYDGTDDGVENFRKNVLMGQMGMNDQQSMKTISQVGSISAEKGSLVGANLYALDKSGVYSRMDPAERAALNADKIVRTQGANKLFSGANSSAFGTETTSGQFKLSLDGKMVLQNTQPELMKQLKDGKINPSLLKDLDRAMSELELMMKNGFLGRQVVGEIRKQAKKRAGETRFSKDDAAKL